ncbi:MAG: hypothetical protein LWX01_06065 [Deltaproteobacteria bacterium]|nr:hypothetical protein [Deltaproteobacteria bacterium]MDL1961252.1 hypothetical protein [Deltaproteobacteria bacterium]
MEMNIIHKHDMLDSIVAVFLGKTGKLPSDTIIMELMKWSDRKTKGISNVKKSRLPNNKNSSLSRN